MKIRYLVAVVVAGLGVAATLRAGTLHPAKTIIYLLRSHGQTVAELKVLKSTTSKVEISGGGMMINSTTQHTLFTAGGKQEITIKISTGDGLPITIKADEIETAPVSDDDFIAMEQ